MVNNILFIYYFIMSGVDEHLHILIVFNLNDTIIGMKIGIFSCYEFNPVEKYPPTHPPPIILCIKWVLAVMMMMIMMIILHHSNYSIRHSEPLTKTCEILYTVAMHFFRSAFLSLLIVKLRSINYVILRREHKQTNKKRTHSVRTQNNCTIPV